MKIVNINEQIYLNALKATKDTGTIRKTRNGITIAILAHQMRFDMQKGFPALTTKQLLFKSVTAEILWFLDAGEETNGRLSLKKLNQIQGKSDEAKNIWTHDQARFEKNGKAKFPGDCGVIYGSQWRRWITPDVTSTIDQVANAIKLLKEDPFSRYIIVTAWNPAKIDDMCLPPCHMKMQFFVKVGEDGKLYLCISMDQRSCDMFLGVPFNIASYALLLHMVAQCVDMLPGELVITLEDCHIYLAGIDEKGEIHGESGHMNQVYIQLARTPYEPPTLWLNPEIKNIDDFTMKDIHLVGYRHQGKLSAELL